MSSPFWFANARSVDSKPCEGMAVVQADPGWHVFRRRFALNLIVPNASFDLIHVRRKVYAIDCEMIKR